MQLQHDRNSLCVNPVGWYATHIDLWIFSFPEPDPMSQASLSPSPVGQYLLLSGIDWRTYTRLLHIFAERPGIRLTYDRGELEIMSPRLEHDNDGRLLGLLVGALTMELGLPIKRGGSTTLRRRLRQRGIEADECFWISNAPRMAGRRRLDLRRDPPPDLAIEVDVTHSSLDRLAIYAVLGVPEVWRLDANNLDFHVLGAEGTYTAAATSLAFSFLTPADLFRFLDQARQAGDENAVERQFRDWIRQQPRGAP
jgi:Uma2 family endonuclease